MKKFLSIIFLICISFILYGCIGQKQSKDLLSTIIKKEKITVGVKFDAKPFGFKDENGEITGFDIDTAREVC